MRSLLVVAAREIRERQALAALPLLLAILPHVGPPLGLWTARDGSALAAVLFTALAVVTTLVTGASAVGRDLGQHRLGFYFSRPLPWWSIWGGKMLGGLLLSLLSALPLVVALALDADKDLLPSGNVGNLLLFVAWVLLGLGVAHFASLAYRSRSTWAVLDFSLLALAAIWLSSVWGRIGLIYMSPRARFRVGDLEQAGLGGLALLFMLAGAIGFAKGRTSERRGRAFASAVVWSLLIPCLLGCEWHIRAMFTVSTVDVATVFSVAPGPDGAWLRVEAARAGGGLAQALYHSGRAQLTPTAWAWHSGHEKYVAFSGDGRWAVWVGRELDFWRWTARLNRLDLRHPAARPEELPIPVGWDTDVLALSRDGTRMLTRNGRAFSMQEIPSGRDLGSQQLGPQVLISAFFEDQQTARLYLRERAETAKRVVVHMHSLSADGGGLETTGQVELPGGQWTFTASADGHRLLAQDFADGRAGGCFAVFDARTGHREFGFGECITRPDSRMHWRLGARFLADGRLAVIERDAASTRLHVVSPQGQAKRAMDLGTARVATLGPEVAPGCVVVGLSGGHVTMSSDEWRVIDLDAAQVLGRGRGHLPLGGVWSDPTTAPPPGSLGASCFVVDGRLMRWDATAREARQLLPLAAR
jgi:hypothetical protein